MPRVEFDEDAIADLDAIYDHIGRSLKSPQAADRMIDRIDAACQRYASQPGMGERRADLGADLRIFSVGSYVVVYRPLADGIRALRVFLGRRNFPAYFRDKPV
jgi:toxin ParE1/3/4